jgi:hypothetical protein
VREEKKKKDPGKKSAGSEIGSFQDFFWLIYKSAPAQGLGYSSDDKRHKKKKKNHFVPVFAKSRPPGIGLA